MNQRRVALVVGIVATCVGAAPAHAELESLWGPGTLPNGHSAFPMYHRLGVDVLQRQLEWNLIAPTRPLHPRDPTDPA